MRNDRQILQIRNGLYFLCLMTVISLIAGIWLNIHLTRESFAKMQALAAPISSQQALLDELTELLESNRLDTLIGRCEQILEEKPLSQAGHYYLGLAYYHKQEPDKSRIHFEEALRIDPAWKAVISPFLDAL